MPGNSPRPGRRTTPKKGAPTGSGGKRRGLKGKAPTLKAEERPWHKAYSGPEPLPKRTAWKQEKERKAKEVRAAARPAGAQPKPEHPRTAKRSGDPGTAKRSGDGPELLVGRNPVVESLRAQVPATGLYVARGLDADDRVSEAIRTAGDRGIAILEVSRGELDRLTGGVVHQGIGLQVPPYAYTPFEDLLASVAAKPAASLAALDRSDATPALLVALDGVTDPRNLGAVIRSAAGFGADGVFLPARRAAGITATAWRTSAGAAARLPVSRVTNLTRALKACQQAGLMVVGLDADADIPVYDLGELVVGPLVLVIGSEGRGLSRLVGTTCDLRAGIPMSSEVESLNASVAAAVALSEVTRARRASG
jgi:23S rRNA (guanosine2251-2'-O)-methyltransferase